MAISDSRLLVAAGRGVESLRWTRTGGYEREAVGVWTSQSLEDQDEEDHARRPIGKPSTDVTGVVFLPDGGQNDTVCLATADGRLVRCGLSFSPLQHAGSRFETSSAPKNQNRGIEITPVAHLPHPIGTSITTLVSSGSTLLTLASKAAQSISTEPATPTGSAEPPLSNRETLVSLYSSSDLDTQGTQPH